MVLMRCINALSKHFRGVAEENDGKFRDTQIRAGTLAIEYEEGILTAISLYSVLLNAI
jgi:hypothetical protein